MCSAPHPLPCTAVAVNPFVLRKLGACCGGPLCRACSLSFPFFLLFSPLPPLFRPSSPSRLLACIFLACVRLHVYYSFQSSSMSIFQFVHCSFYSLEARLLNQLGSCNLFQLIARTINFRQRRYRAQTGVGRGPVLQVGATAADARSGRSRAA